MVWDIVVREMDLIQLFLAIRLGSVKVAVEKEVWKLHCDYL